MRKLEKNEYALLELLVLKPLSIIPPMHSASAARLWQKGLLTQHGEQWHATAEGLKTVGRTLH